MYHKVTNTKLTIQNILLKFDNMLMNKETMKILCMGLSLLLLILILILIKIGIKNPTYEKLGKSNISGNMIKKALEEINKDIVEYIEINRPYELQKKTSQVVPKHNKKEYFDTYSKNISFLTSDDEILKTKLVDEIKHELREQLTKPNYKKWTNRTKNIDWNVIKLNNNDQILEFDYPFTLGKWIYLRPYHFTSNDYQDTKKTLFHEYIHVIQRKKQKHFNRRYIKNLNYIKLDNYSFKNEYEKNVITNPDSPDNGWLVYFKNPEILFMPALLFDNQQPKEYAIIFKSNDYPDLFEKIRNSKKTIRSTITIDSNEKRPLSEIKQYTDMLKLTSGIYNPNEYLAKILDTSFNQDPDTLNRIISLYF